MSSCVQDFEPWWCELDCPVCPLELFSPESEWPELPDGINPRSSGVIIIMLSLSAAFFELTLARSDIWLSISIVSDESIVCNVSNLILTLSQLWISVNGKCDVMYSCRCRNWMSITFSRNFYGTQWYVRVYARARTHVRMHTKHDKKFAKNPRTDKITLSKMNVKWGDVKRWR